MPRQQLFGVPIYMYMMYYVYIIHIYMISYICVFNIYLYKHNINMPRGSNNSSCPHICTFDIYIFDMMYTYDACICDFLCICVTRLHVIFYIYVRRIYMWFSIYMYDAYIYDFLFMSYTKWILRHTHIYVDFLFMYTYDAYTCDFLFMSYTKWILTIKTSIGLGSNYPSCPYIRVWFTIHTYDTHLYTISYIGLYEMNLYYKNINRPRQQLFVVPIHSYMIHNVYMISCICLY